MPTCGGSGFSFVILPRQLRKRREKAAEATTSFIMRSDTRDDVRRRTTTTPLLFRRPPSRIDSDTSRNGIGRLPAGLLPNYFCSTEKKARGILEVGRDGRRKLHPISYTPGINRMSVTMLDRRKECTHDSAGPCRRDSRDVDYCSG